MSNLDSKRPNPATLWAQIFVEEVVRGGLQAVCIAPGSRSTALALAFSAQPGVRIYRHLDERSAAFFALGLALASDRPVGLVCTSGTATANFLPAVVEAKMSQVPLLLMTADRPPELRHSGANQTIDQVKMYGDQVLWSVDVALPEGEAPDVARRNLRTLAARALAVADGIVKGPVHLNFPFRKPFEPAAAPHIDPQEEQSASREPYSRISRGVLAPSAAQIQDLAELLEAHPRGLIVCGPRCPGGDFPQAVAALSQKAGYPILADPLSGLRFGPWLKSAPVCGGYETILAGESDPWGVPDVVLRFGAVPTSKWLNAYLQRSAESYVVHVRHNGVWADDAHRTRLLLQADEALTCRQVARRLAARPTTSWLEKVRATEEAHWRALDEALAGEYFDGAVVADLVELLPAQGLLFAGNSLPIRHVDQFGRPRSRRLHVFGNRGASGIDGNTSTALGIAAARRRPLVLLVGDVTFYHDLNGLLAVREHDLAVTVVLLNNDGGGIFRRLPVAEFDPPFRELFLTPHGLSFAPAAEMYGFEHVRVTSREAFRRAFQESVTRPRRLIEVVTGGERDHARRGEVMDRVRTALS